MNLSFKKVLSFYLIAFFGINFSVSQEMVLPPEYIKTITIRSSDGNGFVPIIPKTGSINLSFDDLEADEKDYYYFVEHCDKHWKTSDLHSTEFVRGYQKELISDYSMSINTLQFYTHYKMQIPNEKTHLLISGNYRLSVLDEEENVIFNRYFIVYEPKTEVGVSVHQSRDLSYLDSQQTIQFVINHKGFPILNPQEEIDPFIFQNFDFSTQINGLKPQFIKPDQILYKYDKETAFWGGNEFLYFDTKELLMPNMKVAQVLSGKDVYESILYTDNPRADEPYTYFPDANGNFVVRNARGKDDALESDYTWVHFTLDMQELLEEKVYVYGAFNNFQLTNDNEMYYNPEINLYEVNILLKQGFYNYNYIILNKENQIDSVGINGSFYETENEYQVVVYYRKFGEMYDRVIGYGRGSSKKINQ